MTQTLTAPRIHPGIGMYADWELIEVLHTLTDRNAQGGTPQEQRTLAQVTAEVARRGYDPASVLADR